MTTPRSCAGTWRRSSCPGIQDQPLRRGAGRPPIAVGPQGVVTFVGTRKDAVWAITDRNKDGAPRGQGFAPSLLRTSRTASASRRTASSTSPSRTASCFPAAEFFYESPDVAVGQVVKQGELIPPEEEASTIPPASAWLGPTSKLYIAARPALQRAAAREGGQILKKAGIGGIIRMNSDGAEAEVFPRRPQSVGRISIQGPASCGSPTTRSTAWATTLRRANSTRITGPGQHFGFPWFGGARYGPTIQGHGAASRHRVRRWSRKCACRRPRPAVLYRQQVPGQIQEGRVHRPARLVKPHPTGRRARAVHAAQR